MRKAARYPHKKYYIICFTPTQFLGDFKWFLSLTVLVAPLKRNNFSLNLSFMSFYKGQNDDELSIPSSFSKKMKLRK